MSAWLDSIVMSMTCIVMSMSRYPTRAAGALGAGCAVALLASLLLVTLPAPPARAQGGVAFVTGYDGYSELGDGGVTGDGSRFSPELVPGLSNVVSASTSYYDTLALLSNGTVEGWGYNRDGELGDGTTEEQSTPAQIPGLSEVTAIAAGFEHGLALLSNGTVDGWGENKYGQLGDGTTEERPTLTPTRVPGLSNVVAISAGCYDSFALLANGTVDAWGENEHGQLGDGTIEKRPTLMPTPVPGPTRVPGLSNVVAISAGCYDSFALLANGTVEAWGANKHGELGDGSDKEHKIPEPVAGLSNVIAISAGGDFGLALLDNGTVEDWGYNEHGELGDGGSEEQLTPEPIPGLTEVAAISAGADFGLALLDNGTVEGWGNNFYGELGDLTSSEHLFSETLTFPDAAVGLGHGVENYDSLVIEGIESSAAQPSPTSALSGTGVEPAGPGLGTQLRTGQPAPNLSGLSLSAIRFRAAASGASLLPASDPAGTVVSYTDSQAATTTFAVQRELSGVSTGRGASRTCARAQRRSERGRQRLARCVYFRTVGSFTHADIPGANRLRFSGRIAGLRLRPGQYRLSAVARSTAGASATRTAAFTIKR